MTGDKNKGVGSCILCGGTAYQNYHKERTGSAAKCWSTWKADCGRSFCSLLMLPDRHFQDRIVSGPYCLQCCSMVLDMHFTKQQLRALEKRMQVMKAKIEDKIGKYCRELEVHTAGTKLKTAQLIAKALERNQAQSSSGTGQLSTFPGATDDFYWNDDNNHENDDHVHNPGNLCQDSPIPVIAKLQLKQEPEPEVRPDPDPDWQSSLEGGFTLSINPVPALVTPKDKKKAPSPSRISRKRKRATKSPQKKKEPSGEEFVLPNLTSDSESSDDEMEATAATTEFKCSRCSANHSCKSALRLHLEREHPDEFYECKVCRAKYRMEIGRYGLNNHMRNVHGGTFPVHCTVCTHGFQTQEELNNHTPIHLSSNPFTCATCKRIFTNSLDLERHIPTHTNAFQCTLPKCGKTFGTQEMLDRHLTCHTRSVICSTCGLGCHSKGALADHMHAHSTEKNFKCHICPASYKMNKGLKRHMMTHTGERPFPCRVCGKAFQLAFQRVRHEEIHSGIKPYLCRFCGKDWVTKNSLRQHESEVHGRRNRGKNAKTQKKRPRKEGSGPAPVVAKAELTEAVPGIDY